MQSNGFQYKQREHLTVEAKGVAGPSYSKEVLDILRNREHKENKEPSLESRQGGQHAK